MTASCLDTLFSVDLQFSEQVVDKRAHYRLMISLTDLIRKMPPSAEMTMSIFVKVLLNAVGRIPHVQ